MVLPGVHIQPLRGAISSVMLLRIMTARLTSRLTMLSLLLALAGVGCGGQDPAEATEVAAAEEAPEPIRELDVDAASALFTSGEAHPVDANGAETRASLGTVPGAALLTSSSQYELSELPADGLLVFYCGSTQCTASDNAAGRAREAGREVAVMRPGIRGWVDAGKPTTGGANSEAAGEAAPAAPAADTEESAG